MASSDTVTTSSVSSDGAARVRPQQEVVGHGLGELRRPAEAAEAGVELAAGLLLGAVQDLGREVTGCARAVGDAGGLRDGVVQCFGLRGDVVAVGAPRLVHRVEHPPEAGHPGAVIGREVGPGVERPSVGVEEDGHRPAAAAGHRLHRLHVDRVDVGPLLAVDLHVDEAGVHDRGHLVVLERLVGHHVAPVTRRVPDREQDRLVVGSGPGERLLAPRVPVDRVVGVLAQVRDWSRRRGGSRFSPARRRTPALRAARRWPARSGDPNAGARPDGRRCRAAACRRRGGRPAHRRARAVVARSCDANISP